MCAVSTPQELTYVLEKVMKEGGEEGEVEELERERVRIMIEACIRKAIDDVVMINQVSQPWRWWWR